MKVSKTLVKNREIFNKNTTTKFANKLRVNISIQVEGWFGVLKSDYEFNIFLNSVKTEFNSFVLITTKISYTLKYKTKNLKSSV